MQGFPGFSVDLGLEGGLERLVGFVGAEEVSVADEEALLVVVGVDEPAGDAVGAVAADFAGVGVENVDAVDLYLDLARLGTVVLDRDDLDVGFAEDHEQVALAGVLEVSGHVQVGVHALEDRDATELAELGGVRLVAESAGDQHVEIGVGNFAGDGHQVWAGDGAELGSDEDAGAAFGAGCPCHPRRSRPSATDEVAGPRGASGEGDAVLAARLLDARRVQVLQDHGREVLLPVVAGLALGKMVDEFVRS